MVEASDEILRYEVENKGVAGALIETDTRKRVTQTCLELSKKLRYLGLCTYALFRRVDRGDTGFAALSLWGSARRRVSHMQ